MTITIGVSACLLGEEVRYDGGHKHDRYLTDILGRHVRFLPLCPEVGCGLPVPREAMRLEEDPEQPRMMTIRTRVDHSERMQAWCTAIVEKLAAADLCGFILKKNSPSCGRDHVKVYTEGKAVQSGSGLFAAALARHFPLLPLEEEGRLEDLRLRENFIERIFGYRRWRDFLKDAPSLGRLQTFHAGQKLVLLAHSPEIYRALGALVARGKEIPLAELLQRYGERYMKGLALPATVRKNTNVLQHIAGYFKKLLAPDEKAELVQLIGNYHDGQLPLIVPLTLLGHYARRYRQAYLLEQTYLFPQPAELLLRYHC